LPNSSSKTVLEEAAGITTTDRHETYGHPLDNHDRTADFWSTYLDMEITAEDVCWMMMLVKVSREMHAPSRDNIVDVCGYARNIEMIQDEREERRKKREELRKGFKGHMPYSRPGNVY